MLSCQTPHNGTDSSPASAGLFFAWCSVLTDAVPAICLHASANATEDTMLTAAECRERAAQKTAEAELQPRHERRLRTAAQGWLVLADIMGRLEASAASGSPSVDPAE
jgi:hypothetical protein